jgi:hypothetical protein
MPEEEKDPSFGRSNIRGEPEPLNHTSDAFRDIKKLTTYKKGFKLTRSSEKALEIEIRHRKLTHKLSSELLGRLSTILK